MNWSSWTEWLAQEQLDEANHPEDMIPAMECDCPPRGTEAE